jgi:hypothetical protein
MFALGLLSWMYTRPTTGDRGLPQEQVRRKPEILAANLAALTAGFNYGETTEDFASYFRSSPPRPMPAGTYRNITGNTALSYGLVAAAHRAGCRWCSAPTRSPRHPTSCTRSSAQAPRRHDDAGRGRDRRHRHRPRGQLRWRARGHDDLGPGLALKSEAIGLAVSLELPLVIVDVQRGGPSTGLPTKTEQADLLQAMFGRNGESPVPIVAPKSPADCFDAAIEAPHRRRRTAPPCCCCPTATSPTAPSRGGPRGRPTCPTSPSSSRPNPTGSTPRASPVPPVPARRRDAGPAVGRARHEGSGAPDRRHREGRRHRQHLLRPRQPRH